MMCRFTINTFLKWTELKFVYYLLTFMFGLLDFHRSLFKEVNYQSKPNESTQVLSKLKTFNINSKFEWNICLSDWGKVQSAGLDLLYWIYELGFVCVRACEGHDRGVQNESLFFKIPYHHTKDLLPRMDSYLQDTPDLLRCLEDVKQKPLPPLLKFPKWEKLSLRTKCLSNFQSLFGFEDFYIIQIRSGIFSSVQRFFNVNPHIKKKTYYEQTDTIIVTMLKWVWIKQ